MKPYSPPEIEESQIDGKELNHTNAEDVESYDGIYTRKIF
jgi:hypothetical protein